MDRPRNKVPSKVVHDLTMLWLERCWRLDKDHNPQGSVPDPAELVFQYERVADQIERLIYY